MNHREILPIVTTESPADGIHQALYRGGGEVIARNGKRRACRPFIMHRIVDFHRGRVISPIVPADGVEGAIDCSDGQGASRRGHRCGFGPCIARRIIDVDGGYGFPRRTEVMGESANHVYAISNDPDAHMMQTFGARALSMTIDR